MPRNPLAGPIPPRSLRINQTHVNLYTPHAAEHVMLTILSLERAAARGLGVTVVDDGGWPGGLYAITWSVDPPAGWAEVGVDSDPAADWANRPADIYRRLLDRGVAASAMRLSPDCRTGAR
jgi:hypothetical protein